MNRVLAGILVAAFGASVAAAQDSSAPNQQQTACHEKVVELTNQLSPLHKHRTALWTERKTIGSSGGDAAKYKLARLDHELTQVTKQIDGVTKQIDNEKKICDDLTAKSANRSKPGVRQ
jgi:hypothetical protein